MNVSTVFLTHILTFADNSELWKMALNLQSLCGKKRSLRRRLSPRMTNIFINWNGFKWNSQSMWVRTYLLVIGTCSWKSIFTICYWCRQQQPEKYEINESIIQLDFGVSYRTFWLWLWPYKTEHREEGNWIIYYILVDDWFRKDHMYSTEYFKNISVFTWMRPIGWNRKMGKEVDMTENMKSRMFWLQKEVLDTTNSMQVFVWHRNQIYGVLIHSLCC